MAPLCVKERQRDRGTERPRDRETEGQRDRDRDRDRDREKNGFDRPHAKLRASTPAHVTKIATHVCDAPSVLAGATGATTPTGTS